MTKKKIIEELERMVHDLQKTMTQQEVIWMREWHAAPNPFIAIKEWNKNHKRRMAYIQPWLDAKENLEKAKKKTLIREST